MLSKEENDFIVFWENNRDSQKRFLKQLSVGLPIGSILVIAIFLNFISGWNKQATMVINANASLIPVLIIAALIIVIFVSVFSVKYKWEVNDQKYQELKAKENKNKTEV